MAVLGTRTGCRKVWNPLRTCGHGISCGGLSPNARRGHALRWELQRLRVEASVVYATLQVLPDCASGSISETASGLACPGAEPRKRRLVGPASSSRADRHIPVFECLRLPSARNDMLALAGCRGAEAPSACTAFALPSDVPSPTAPALRSAGQADGRCIAKALFERYAASLIPFDVWGQWDDAKSPSIAVRSDECL